MALQIKADGVPTQQLWCNSDIYHFDLSYWAFQQLAHPTYGVMMVDFRYASSSLTYAEEYAFALNLALHASKPVLFSHRITHVCQILWCDVFAILSYALS